MRRTRRDYPEGPGSFDRIREAAYALAEVETDETHDADFHRADMRLRAAVKWYLRAVIRRLPRRYQEVVALELRGVPAGGQRKRCPDRCEHQVELALLK